MASKARVSSGMMYDGEPPHGKKFVIDGDDVRALRKPYIINTSSVESVLFNREQEQKTE